MELVDRISMVIVSLTKTFPVRVCEWLLSGIAISTSILLWNIPDDQWAAPAFIGLARIADHQTWGALIFAVGFLRLVALIRNGGWAPSPHLRAAGAFLCCFAWAQISLGLFAAPIVLFSMAIFPWLLAADIYNVFRASHDARMSDERGRNERRQSQGSREGDTRIAT